VSSPLLVVIFLAATAATWAAGTRLSSATDALDRRYDLGEDIGGLILLAVAGTLPEIAITVSAAASGKLALAAGNLIGGIGVQTMVLVACDVAVAGPRPLSYLVGSLMPVLEGLLVVLVLAAVLMGGLLPSGDSIGPLSPASLAIVILWLGGVILLNRVSRTPQWEVEMPGSRPGRRHRRHRHHPVHPGAGQATPNPHPAAEAPNPHPPAEAPNPQPAAGRPLLVFALGSAITLGAGVALELTGNELAGRAGINGVIFGATFLSLATALPEISSGVAAVRLGDHRLAVGDIFGGNAFQLCLFLPADLLAGKAVLPAAGRANSWLAILGIALTSLYAGGVIVRSPRRVLRMGLDSLLAVAVFGVGIAGLVAVAT
jgi:cation:H+ antiporter